MFTFGIVMCFVSAAIYGIVVYVEIKRIDWLESQQIITTDRLNFYRDRYQSQNACLVNQAGKIVEFNRRLDRIERHPIGRVETRMPMDADAHFGKPLSVYPNMEPGDIHPFTPDAFVTTDAQLAEVA